MVDVQLSNQISTKIELASVENDVLKNLFSKSLLDQMQEALFKNCSDSKPFPKNKYGSTQN